MKWRFYLGDERSSVSEPLAHEVSLTEESNIPVVKLRSGFEFQMKMFPHVWVHIKDQVRASIPGN